MKNKINYYYYYLGSYHLPNLTPKGYDIEQCMEFIKTSSGAIKSITENSNFSKKIKSNYSNHLSKTIKNEVDYNFQDKFKAYVEDVSTTVAIELKSIKKILLDTNTINDCWEKLEIVGMTSIQLETKLNMWYTLYDGIKELFDRGVNYINTNRKKILEFLAFTDIIFGSLFKTFVNLDVLEELLKIIDFLIR
jgi:hypothetical protein